VLRAYDENQSRPLFVDRKSNKEVRVDYTVSQSPRSTATNVAPRSSMESQTPRTGVVKPSPSTHAKPNEAVRTGESNPRVNNGTDQNNPRTQGTRPVVNQRMKPTTPVTNGRSEAVRSNSNVMTERNATPVKPQVEKKVESRVMPQAQESRAKVNPQVPANQRMESNVAPRPSAGQGNGQSTNVRSQSNGKQQEQRVR
jgi:hypothetical protein